MDFGALFNTYALPVWLALYPYLFGGGAAVAAIWAIKKWLSDPENKYTKWYPLVLAAVRYVEKTIKDDTQSKSLKKADIFLKEFIRLYEAENGAGSVDSALKNWANRMKEVALMEVDKVKNPTPPTE